MTTPNLTRYDRVSDDRRSITTEFVLNDSMKDDRDGISSVVFSISSSCRKEYGITRSYLARHLAILHPNGMTGTSYNLRNSESAPIPEVRVMAPRFNAKKLQQQHDEYVSRVLHPAQLGEVIAWALREREEVSA